MDDRPPDRQDLDSILDFMVGFAQQTLRNYGEFYPFGAVLNVEGDLVAQAGKLVETDKPPAQKLIDLIVAGMKSQAQSGAIRASGLCYDIKWQMTDGTTTDAIAASLEHSSGLAVLVVQPYSKRRLGGFRFDELIAQAGERRIFGRDALQQPGDIGGH